MNVSRLLLRLYPRVWRARYEEEVLALLESRPLAFSDGLDLIVGTIDAHLHPQLGTSGLPRQEKLEHLSRTLRGSLLAGFCAYTGFALAGFGFQKLTEDPAFMAVANSSATVGLAFHLVVIGGVASVLAMLAGGLPILCAVVKCALKQRRHDLLLLLSTPFLAVELFIGVVELLLLHIINRLPWFAGGIFFFGGLLLVAIISAAAICAAVARSHVAGRLLRFAVLPSTIVAIAMALVLLATICWGLDLQHEAPQLLAGNAGIMRTSTMDTFLRIIAIMALATALAAGSLVRALSLRLRLRQING
jgi:hypothetical protein